MTYTEYNLEFQGSIWNLQKRALFMKFYPEMPWNNTEMRYNNTTFGTKARFYQMLQRAASNYWMLISPGLFLAIQIRKNSRSHCIILNKTPEICPYNWTMIDVRCVTITCLTEVLVKSRVAIMASLIEKGVCAYQCNHPPIITRFGTLYTILPKTIIKVMTEVIKFVFKTKVRMSIWIIEHPCDGPWMDLDKTKLTKQTIFNTTYFLICKYFHN